MTGRRSTGAILFLILPMLAVLGGAGPGSAAAHVAQRATRATVPAACLTPARRGFTPTSAIVAGVGTAPVLALGRGRGRVPLAPPLTTSGKNSFAWDKLGPKPGGSRGNVRFNAHTYPDGSALGNRLLGRLKVGRRIILSGNGYTLCYRVTRRVVTSPHHLAAYYNTTGSAKLAIVVCSGRRLGPGNWTKRTIWYAKPSVS